ncbi:MAG TPA: YIP1 family protein [Thermodesulfobacteriota bacterium]|jgi:hypothetical protein
MNLVNKMIRAAKLDVQLYEEVEKDIGSTKEAFLVVLIGAICNGIGSVEMLGAKGIITGVISGIIGWLLWSAVIYLIGVKVFKHTSDMGELLRCLGFAYSPNVLSILGIIPGIGLIIRFIASIWVLIAFVVAARQALDCGTGRAILISVLGFVAFIIVFAIFFFLVGHS